MMDCHFTREKIKISTYFKSGKKFKLPMEMIILLYKHKLQSEEEDLNKIRMEHKKLY